MKKVFLTVVLMTFLAAPQTFAGVFQPVRPDQVPSGLVYDVAQPPVIDPDQFAGKKVAILASHGVEESEIVFPYTYLKRRGAQIDIVVPSWTAEGIAASQFLKPTLFVSASHTFLSAQNKTYDLLILTGGAWNAQVVRSDSDAIKLIKSHYSNGGNLAAICAGTSILINAGIAKNQHLTGSPVVAPDLINAGAHFVDEAAVWGDHLLTSRSPNDLPQFVAGIAAMLSEKF